jgi:hypothetical protein
MKRRRCRWRRVSIIRSLHLCNLSIVDTAEIAPEDGGLCIENWKREIWQVQKDALLVREHHVPFLKFARFAMPAYLIFF